MCDKQFEDYQSNNDRQFCGVECSKVYRASHRKLRICTVCNNEFRPTKHYGGLELKQNRFYCSDDCKNIDKTKRKEKNKKPVKIVNKKIKEIVYDKCYMCSKSFIKKNFKHVTCSQECGYNKNKQDRRLPQTSLKCDYCNKSFIGIHSRRYCSQKCGERDNKITDRIRKYGSIKEKIYKKKIFEKYNWKCVVCDTLTPIELRGTKNDNAPELDHIVPLSKGGTHTNDNMQLLCRNCNNLKSNHFMEDFVEAYNYFVNRPN